MAHSRCLNTQTDPRDLIHCGICHVIVDKPRMLPCLHSFCLHCLSSWAESAAEKDPEKYKTKIRCPCCKQVYDLPAGGVKTLQTNFFVLKLKEMRTIKQKLDSDNSIPCTACESSINSVSYCIECHEFLCKECVDAHNRSRFRVLRDHQLLSLDEIQADSLGKPMFNFPEQEKCQKHGEALVFFCEKCEIPICRNCTLLDHPNTGYRAEHIHVDLKEAADRCTKKLNEREQECRKASDALNRSIKMNERTLADFKSAVVTAERDILKASDMFKIACLSKLHTLAAKRERDISSHTETLQSLQPGFHDVLQVSNTVTHIGSDLDKATMFSALSSAMKKTCEIRPTAIETSLAEVRFKPNEELGKFGSLVADWNFVLDKTFGQGLLKDARCPVFNIAGDIAVTMANKVLVLGHDDGQVKMNINTADVGGRDYHGHSRPWGLVIGKEGQYFVTDTNPYVKVFDAQGKFKYRFRPIDASGYLSYRWKSEQELYGLAIDCSGRLIVGSKSKRNSISIHRQDQQNGSHESYFTIDEEPYFIAVTSTDRFLVSDNRYLRLYNNTGEQMLIFTAPVGNLLRAAGVCCVRNPSKDEEEVYVASATRWRSPAIYRYPVNKNYIGVITKDVKDPRGISIKMVADDDVQLLVADGDTVRVFRG